MSRILNTCVRPFLRLFMPGIAAGLREEGQFSLRDAPASGNLDPSLYMDVEDNGADTTIVTFAGMAVLYAAMPKFEFRNLLLAGGEPRNLVFVRDVYRSSYRLAPDGSDLGIAFYERAVTDVLNQLGSSRNIAVGMSGGGEAAFRISGAAPIHRVIAFNPGFPLERYGSWSNLAHVLFDVRKLVREPHAYLEVVFVTLGARFLWKRGRRLFGPEEIDRPLRDYLRRAAPATLYYSTRCHPDTQQALALHDVPSVEVKPLDSARHNCFAELKKQGAAAAFIQKALGQRT